jgi:hypothetical protein
VPAHLTFDFKLHLDDARLYFLDDSLSVLQRKSYFLHRSEGSRPFDLGDHLFVECTV